MNLHPEQIDIQNTAKFWPNTSQLRQRLSVPLALSFSPTSQESNQASFNDKNLEKYRCQSCKAFINKYCQIKNQNQYDCSLCGFSNKVDQKIDLNAPQITSPTYKCKASKIQRTVMSKERLIVFILDLSNYGEFSQKYLLYTIRLIKEFINKSVREKKNIKIMLLAFDDGLQLFHIKTEVQRFLFWDDQAASNTQYPFNYQQIGLISECKDNLFEILDVLEEEVTFQGFQVNERKFRSNTSSKKIMQTVEYALKHTKTQSGKIFVVSGLNHELQKFKVMRNYDSTIQDSYKHHYPIVKKQCLTDSLNNLLSITQMSVSFFFHKSMYAVNHFLPQNLMPFHVISKSTNGELRHYLRHQIDHFFYEFNYLIHEYLYEMKFQTLLRVRSGVGLKLVGIFGNYRAWKGIPEQVELLSCQSNRKYTFEFIIEGKINSPSTILQFSVLYTDLKGNRFYRIITQKVDLSSEVNTILNEIDYNNVNLVYLRAVLHNMDLTPHYRKLQIALQDRCKRHLQILRQSNSEKVRNLAENNENLINLVYMRNARSYVIFTFMLMQHFLLNLHERRDIFLDVNIQTRNKLMTYEDAIQIIWPMAYVIKEDSYEIVEMKLQNFEQGSMGIVIDRGDRVEIYVQKAQLRNVLRVTKDVRKAIKDCAQLENVSRVLQEIEQKKNFPHLDIILVEYQYMMGFCIFSRKGNHSFENFIETLLEN